MSVGQSSHDGEKVARYPVRHRGVDPICVRFHDDGALKTKKPHPFYSDTVLLHQDIKNT